MKNILITTLLLTVVAACTPGIPQDAKDVNKPIPTYPDNADVVIPYNIAPLNFHIDIDDADPAHPQQFLLPDSGSATVRPDSR